MLLVTEHEPLFYKWVAVYYKFIFSKVVMLGNGIYPSHYAFSIHHRPQLCHQSEKKTVSYLAHFYNYN